MSIMWILQLIWQRSMTTYPSSKLSLLKWLALLFSANMSTWSTLWYPKKQGKTGWGRLKPWLCIPIWSITIVFRNKLVFWKKYYANQGATNPAILLLRLHLAMMMISITSLDLNHIHHLLTQHSPRLLPLTISGPILVMVALPFHLNVTIQLLPTIVLLPPLWQQHTTLLLVWLTIPMATASCNWTTNNASNSLPSYYMQPTSVTRYDLGPSQNNGRTSSYKNSSVKATLKNNMACRCHLGWIESSPHSPISVWPLVISSSALILKLSSLFCPVLISFWML